MAVINKAGGYLIVIFIITIMLSSSGCSRDNSNPGSGGDIYIPFVPQAHITFSVVSADKNTYGDVEIDVQLSNSGDASGSITLKAMVTVEGETFSEIESITVPANAQRSISYYIDLPWWAFLSSWSYQVQKI